MYALTGGEMSEAGVEMLTVEDAYLVRLPSLFFLEEVGGFLVSVLIGFHSS